MHRPQRPDCCGQMLLQRILAHERRVLPCCTSQLHFNAMPDCARPPFRIVRVQTTGSPPTWTVQEDKGCGPLPIRITLPLCVQVCDACGQMHTLSATAEVETCLPRHLCAADGCRSTLWILPCVQLICASPWECGCAQVQLHVTLECFLLRYETCPFPTSQPPCPQLPLYPQPCRC